MPADWAAANGIGGGDNNIRPTQAGPGGTPACAT